MSQPIHPPRYDSRVPVSSSASSATMDTETNSDSASATLQDLTEDWAYFEHSEKRSDSVHQPQDGSESSIGSRSLLDWRSSDYAPSTSSAADRELDEDTFLTDSDPTILGPTDTQYHATTSSKENSRPISLPPAASKTRESVPDGRSKRPLSLNTLQHDTAGQYAQIGALEASILQSLQALNDFESLSALRSNLTTPIHGPLYSHTVPRFAEENLPPYDRAIVAAKLEKLHELESAIHEGCRRYDILSNLLATDQWSKQYALQHWDKNWIAIACNEERSAVDHLLATIPFQVPKTSGASINAKWRGRSAREFQASEAHVQANERAKSWRGHIRIHDNHLQMHMRVFGLNALPELPKEVFLPMTELPNNDDDGDLASIPESPLGDESTGGREDIDEAGNARETNSRLSKKEKMVKSHSKKALQVLGLKS